jgi:hypothetical protein
MITQIKLQAVQEHYQTQKLALRYMETDNYYLFLTFLKITEEQVEVFRISNGQILLSNILN